MAHRGVVVLAAILGMVALWESLGVVHDSLAVARSGAHTSRTARLLLPAQVVGVQDTTLYPELAQLIPRGATYGIQAEPDAPPSEYAGGEGVAFVNYWLLPRRQVGITEPQDYTIVFGSLPAGLRYVKATTVAEGVTLLEDR